MGLAPIVDSVTNDTVVSFWAMMLRFFAAYTATAAALSLPSLAAQTLEIMAPADRSIVNPGQTVTVKVTSRDATFRHLVVRGPGGYTPESDIPGQYNISIPKEACCGTRRITAVGVLKTAEEPVYSSISIDVERPDLPVKLQANPSQLFFDSPGVIPLPFLFRAFFRDGSNPDVRESSRVTYSSANPAIAKIDKAGWVYALLPGRTVVSANYRLEGKSIQLTIPINVDVGAIAASTYSLSFGDQSIGTSTEKRVVLTNITHGPVKILAVKAQGGFSETDNCASLSPLEPTRTCTVKVIFTASKAGLQEGSLTIANSASEEELGISVTGTGR